MISAKKECLNACLFIMRLACKRMQTGGKFSRRSSSVSDALSVASLLSTAARVLTDDGQIFSHLV
jgi:hypothetical protein